MERAGFLKWKKLARERLALESKMMSVGEMLPGSFFEQKINCGRKTCRCADGKLHGPYFYLSRRVQGKTRMIYLKDRRMIVAAKNYREFQKTLTRWRQVTRSMEEMLVATRFRKLIRKNT